jgi:hypothetical protein
VEVGWDQEIWREWTFSVAGGRWGNYRGKGFHAGDWFGRVGVNNANLRLSASLLRGESDTVLLDAGYELHPAPALAILATIAYDTGERTINPGVELTYELTSSLALTTRVVAPQGTERRRIHASFGITWSLLGRDPSM